MSQYRRIRGGFHRQLKMPQINVDRPWSHAPCPVGTPYRVGYINEKIGHLVVAQIWGGQSVWPQWIALQKSRVNWNCNCNYEEKCFQTGGFPKGCNYLEIAKRGNLKCNRIRSVPVDRLSVSIRVYILSQTPQALNCIYIVESQKYFWCTQYAGNDNFVQLQNTVFYKSSLLFNLFIIMKYLIFHFGIFPKTYCRIIIWEGE